MNAIYDWVFQLWPDALVFTIARWHMGVGGLILLFSAFLETLEIRSAKNVSSKRMAILLFVVFALVGAIAVVNGYLIYRWKMG
ncbi:hypothetical protein [Novosphingopyxis baekryungensis]|uniref:hypothetical protein n=1 Tax=Novosphingopyxis baekryungensis TaxID=279369 RepID=UPI0003B79E97|nr:hypothetical protein [Novosphingopyxis baekryungensis]